MSPSVQESKTHYNAKKFLLVTKFARLAYIYFADNEYFGRVFLRFDYARVAERSRASVRKNFVNVEFGHG